MKYGGEQAFPLPLLSIIQINIAFNPKTVGWILWFLIVDPDLLNQEEVVVEEEEEEEEEEEDGEEMVEQHFLDCSIFWRRKEKLWKWRLNIFFQIIFCSLGRINDERRIFAFWRNRKCCKSWAAWSF